MYKRPDTDIFGAKTVEPVMKIKNDSFVDPNQAFKRKNDQNYQLYANKIGNKGRKNIEGNPQMTKVNEKVKFDDEYHRNRKQRDMQSSIFYQPVAYTRPQTANLNQKPLKQKPTTSNHCYGRKNTFQRQIENLPYNQSNIKGNQSQLFDFDRNIQSQCMNRGQQPVLIPHQMQWDQHDSIKYNHHKQVERNPILNNQSKVFVKQIQQTKSIQNSETKKQREQTLKQLANKNNSKSTTKNNIKMKKINNDSGKKAINPITHQLNQLPNNIGGSSTNDVEVQILRGWDPKFLEGLTKYCKLYSSPMTKFEMQGQGKAVIYLKRSKKWEAVTDWLTKDAKLKIRVTNPGGTTNK